MSSEWPQYQLSDIGRIVTGKTPSTAQDEFFGGSLPFLTPTDMIDGQKSVSASRTLTDAGLATVKNCLIPRGVAVSCIGWQMGKSVLVLEPTVTNQQINTIVVDESRFDISFIYYLLSSIRNKIFELGATATRTPIVNKSTFGQIKVLVPSISEQKNIAVFFSSLDDRITLLRETNATLESIAQALFKSWFVDFDQVRAKAEGLEPEGLDAATAALFPDSFEESELGLVPRGWTEVPLGQLCSFQKGCSYKGDGLSDDQGAYMFNLGCFNSPRVFAFEKVKRYTGDFRDKHRVSGGDLIIANTDMTQHRAILGRPLLVPDGMAPGFVSHHVFKAVINQEYGAEIKHFLFFCFLQSSFRERAVGYATGTTVLALPKDALEHHLINLPGHELIKAFANYCEPIFSSIQANEVQAQNLTQLRDTLLPRLISGQLRLPETEASVENMLPEAV